MERPSGFKEVAGTEKDLPCELVLLAMGFMYPEKENVLNKMNVEVNERGNIKTVDDKYQTNINKIFAAGDMRRGQSLVVWAIAEGRKCAEEVDAFLAEQK